MESDESDIALLSSFNIYVNKSAWRKSGTKAS